VTMASTAIVTVVLPVVLGTTTTLTMVMLSRVLIGATTVAIAVN